MNHENLQNESYENPWADFSIRELPKTSTNKECAFFLREIERSGKTEKVAHFIDEKLATEAKQYDSVESFYESNPGYEDELDQTLSLFQKETFKNYSGYNFAWINSVARGFWDYEKMGEETPEKRAEVEKTIRDISEAIPYAPSPKEDFMTFRGTNLDAFRSYGVEKLSDLEKLKEQFYLDRGFASSALVRENSFVDKDEKSFWIDSSNVEIRYHIPSGSNDCIALFDDSLSYSPGQTEVLMNRWALNYVSDVKINDDRAVVDMLLIPHDLYDSPE